MIVLLFEDGRGIINSLLITRERDLTLAGLPSMYCYELASVALTCRDYNAFLLRGATPQALEAAVKVYDLVPAWYFKALTQGF